MAQSSVRPGPNQGMPLLDDDVGAPVAPQVVACPDRETKSCRDQDRRPQQSNEAVSLNKPRSKYARKQARQREEEGA